MKNQRLQLFINICFAIGIFIFVGIFIASVLVDKTQLDIYTLSIYINYRNIFILIAFILVLLKMLTLAYFKQKDM